MYGVRLSNCNRNRIIKDAEKPKQNQNETEWSILFQLDLINPV